MSDPEVSDLESALGRQLSPIDRGSIETLNALPDSVIAEARRLQSSWLIRKLIEYYCGLACRPYLSDFIQSVVTGAESAQVWRRGDVIVPAPSLADQLRLTRDALLAPVGGYGGRRIVPNLASWKAGASWVGAPAVPRPDADYRTDAPAGAVSLAHPTLEAAPDADLAIRRWTASRIARSLAPGQDPSADSLLARIPSSPPVHEWSHDARIALAALAREHRELPPVADEVPGFRGPDSWYTH